MNRLVITVFGSLMVGGCTMAQPGVGQEADLRKK